MGSAEPTSEIARRPVPPSGHDFCPPGYLVAVLHATCSWPHQDIQSPKPPKPSPPVVLPSLSHLVNLKATVAHFSLSMVNTLTWFSLLPPPLHVEWCHWQTSPAHFALLPPWLLGTAASNHPAAWTGDPTPLTLLALLHAPVHS